jgi:hypothetical protein
MFSVVLTTIGIGLASLSPASAAPCGHIHLSMGQHVVAPGETVLVSGSTCVARDRRPRKVQIRIRTPHGWKRVAVAHTTPSGDYRKRIRVGKQMGHRKHKTRVQVKASKARTSKQLTIASAAKRPAAATTPVAATPAPEKCPLDESGVAITTDTVPACQLIASDTSADPNENDFWGQADCGPSPEAREPNQAADLTAGGDEHPTATGAPQPDSAYRTMTVFDGDNIWGERCELGLNNFQIGPTAFYHEGDRRATFFSELLPENFPLAQSNWQVVMQMKQAEPMLDADVGPMIEMQAENNRWIISREWHVVWSFPAKKNFWTRFVFNVVYSQNPEIGSLQVGVDLNGDGDFTDPGEMSPVIHGATLATQVAPGYPTPVGGSIPSHLRMGIYHDPQIECPRPVGCSTDVDNVQVMAP